MKHFETELPERYGQVFEIDAKERKTAVRLNLAAFVIMAIVFLLFALTIGFSDLFRLTAGKDLLVFWGIFTGGMIVYIVLHELVHGAAYKLLTHHKLTFGLSLSCAYCGVPDIYVYRTASLLAILAPFVVFTVVFLALALLLHNHPAVRLASVMLFCAHVGGCAGDLYGAYLMLFRFRDSRLLVRDTGPKQTYYLPDKTE